MSIPQIVRLFAGPDLLAQVEVKKKKMILTKPLVLQMVPNEEGDDTPRVSMTPFIPPYFTSPVMELDVDKVLFGPVDVAPELLDKYYEMTGLPSVKVEE